MYYVNFLLLCRRSHLIAYRTVIIFQNYLTPVSYFLSGCRDDPTLLWAPEFNTFWKLEPTYGLLNLHNISQAFILFSGLRRKIWYSYFLMQNLNFNNSSIIYLPILIVAPHQFNLFAHLSNC